MKRHEDNGFDGVEGRLSVELIERLNEPLYPIAAVPDEPPVGNLVRELTEVAGLLPYELEALPPDAAARERILRSIVGSGTAGPVSDRTGVGGGDRSRVAHPWSLRLVAALALVLVGMSGWQYADRQRQERAIEQLAARLSDIDRDEVEVGEMRQQLQRARENLALVSSRGVQVCSLHSDGTVTETQPATHGMLFVASDLQRWYLTVEGLAPCPQGRQYQLWFHFADGGAVSGGVFEVGPGKQVELTSDSMPRGSVAVSITMEPAGGSASPSGPSVLFGDQMVQIL